jgi:hypothetical protein
MHHPQMGQMPIQVQNVQVWNICCLLQYADHADNVIYTGSADDAEHSHERAVAPARRQVAPAYGAADA